MWSQCGVRIAGGSPSSILLLLDHIVPSGNVHLYRNQRMFGLVWKTKNPFLQHGVAHVNVKGE
jgi:hypothetical protein